MKNIFRTILQCMCFCASFGTPSLSQANEPVSVRVLQGWNSEKTTRISGLHLQLQEGWKTYWRVPGEAGIPPQFSWKGSRNVQNIEISWPQPFVFKEAGMRSIGYKGDLYIPLHITVLDPAQPIRLKGVMDIGICKDICMPFALKFDETLEKGDTKVSPEIAASLASGPLSAKEAGVKSIACHISPIDDGLQIKMRIRMPQAGVREEAAIEVADPKVYVSEPKIHRQGDEIIAVSQMYHQDQGGFLVDRSKLRTTIIGTDYSVDIRGCFVN